jgi:Na+/H+ antiporter 1
MGAPTAGALTPSLSGIDGRAPCYPAFLQVVWLRKCRRDGVNCAAQRDALAGRLAATGSSSHHQCRSAIPAHVRCDLRRLSLATYTATTGTPSSIRVGIRKSSSLISRELFALANAGVAVGGKPLGTGVAGLVGVRPELGTLPDDMTVRHLWGLGALAGVGFTVSLSLPGIRFARSNR